MLTEIVESEASEKFAMSISLQLSTWITPATERFPTAAGAASGKLSRETMIAVALDAIMRAPDEYARLPNLTAVIFGSTRKVERRVSGCGNSPHGTTDERRTFSALSRKMEMCSEKVTIWLSKRSYRTVVGAVLFTAMARVKISDRCRLCATPFPATRCERVVPKGTCTVEVPAATVSVAPPGVKNAISEEFRSTLSNGISTSRES
jgi:hypothetical protein